MRLVVYENGYQAVLAVLPSRALWWCNHPRWGYRCGEARTAREAMHQVRRWARFGA